MRCYVNILEKYKNDIQNLINHSFADRVLDNTKVNSAGSIIINGNHISTMWLTMDDISVEDFNVLSFSECNVENPNFLVNTDGFNYRDIDKEKFNSMFRFEEPELEYDNFVTVENITKIIFGNAVLHNTTDKYYLSTNRNIKIGHSQLVELNEGYATNYFYLKYTGGKDIWSDDVFRSSLQEKIKIMTSLEYELNDIQPDNLKEIGRQVKAIIY